MSAGAAIRAAFGSFSTLPVGPAQGAPDASALEALPLVGFVTGGLAGFAGVALAPVVPRELLPPLVVTLRLGLTGAIHLDGYLDACDALFASVPPDRRLEILRDPRHGTYALAGFAAWLPLELAALRTIPLRRWPLALATVGLLARAAAVANARGAPYARSDVPAAFARVPRAAPLLAAGAAGALLGARVFRGGWIVLPFVAFPAGRALGAFARAQFGGGLSGDAYGWTIVVLETALLACVACASPRR